MAHKLPKQFLNQLAGYPAYLPLVETVKKEGTPTMSGYKLPSDRWKELCQQFGLPSKPKSKGLGDTIAKVTAALGIQPCGGCKERQKALNKAFPYPDR